MLALLPLRLFLGVTFVYAGVQKLSDPGFLHKGAPTYIGAQLHAFASGTPGGFILRTFAIPHPALAGVGVAFVEIAVGLLVGQLVGQRRKASGITVGLLVATYFVNNLVEGLSNLKWAAWLFPFHYYSVSKPLVPGRTLEVGAWSALVAFTVIALALAGYLFTRRDIGFAFPVFRSRERAQRRPWRLLPAR